MKINEHNLEHIHNNLSYSKKVYTWCLVIWFFALTWIFLKEYWQFILWILIILWTLGYKEISLRIASWSKLPTIKECIIIILIIAIYTLGDGFLGSHETLASIPFGLVFVNYIKLFLPKWSNWKSDVILIISSIILITLALNLNWAIKAFNSYLDEYNNRVNNLLEEWLYLHESWKDIEAIWVFNKVIELEPKNIDAYSWKWLIVHELWKYNEALEIFNKILIIDPLHQSTYRNRWFTLLKLNRQNESIDSFNKAIELNPSDAYSYDGKWNALSQLREYDDAMSMYEKSIKLNPNYDLPYYARWVLLMNINQNWEAMEMFDKCLSINPKNTKCQEGKQHINKMMDTIFAPLLSN